MAFAVQTLEFDAVREQLARHSSFSAGRQLALELAPTSELSEARRRQATTAEALRLPGLRPGLHLGGVHDIRPLAERARGRVASIVTTYGRVPMFYYLLHIPLIHATALLVWFLRDGSAGATRFHTAPDVFIPPAYRWSLGLLYLVFAIVVAALYPLCRWYAERKATKPAGWMRYI